MFDPADYSSNPTIFDFRKGSSGELPGLKKGDKIISIDDQRAETIFKKYTFQNTQSEIQDNP
jgi:hypothetical protein